MILSNETASGPVIIEDKRQNQGCGARTFHEPPEVCGRMEDSKQPSQIPRDEADKNGRIDNGGLSQSTHSRESSPTEAQLSLSLILEISSS